MSTKHDDYIPQVDPTMSARELARELARTATYRNAERGYEVVTLRRIANRAMDAAYLVLVSVDDNNFASRAEAAYDAAVLEAVAPWRP
jgi:hypothetical protein